MKQTIKNIMAAVVLLLTTTAVLGADNVTVVKQLNGTVNDNAGSVEAVVNAANATCTLTVTPATGNYMTVDYITVTKTMDAGSAQAPRRSPNLSDTIAVYAVNASADPSGETQYTFTMPSQEYGVEVTANFQSRQSIEAGVMTLQLPENGYFFDGEAKVPVVTVILGGDTLAVDNYSVAYSNNINAGMATVTVTGAKTYTGTLTENFMIAKTAITPTVSLDDWTYGQTAATPVVDGNPGNSEVTYFYKVRNAGDDTYDQNVPTNAGNYTVKAVIAESDNYAAGEATADFAIDKAALSGLKVSVNSWTYGDTPATPIVENNLGGGAVTYSYSFSYDDTFSPEVPTDADDYTIRATVAESDNYLGGEADSTFHIYRADFSQLVIADIDDQTYTGTAIKPAITVTFKGNPVNASEYDVHYTDSVNVGTATVSLTTRYVNFMAGEVNPSKTYQIVAAQAVISGTDQTVTFNGEPQDYTNGSVTAGTVTVKYYLSAEERTAGQTSIEGAPADAGTYYVQLVQGDPNYSSTPVNVTFIIEPKTLDAEMVIMDELEFIYDGEAKTPEVFVSDEEIKDSYVMSENDYEISYSNNINVGTASVTVTGKGNYEGTVVLNFQIMRQLNVSFGPNSWASYFAAEDLAIPEELEAYIVTGVEGNTVTATQIDYIPQGVGVMLYNAGAAPDVLVAAAWDGEVQTFESNMLQGCASATAVSGLTAENDIYVLYNDEFVKTTSGTIPANRCYLPVAKSQNAGARMAIVFDSDDTAIGELVNAKSVNGQYVFDLNGRRLSAMPTTKGLYIINGKKVVVK